MTDTLSETTDTDDLLDELRDWLRDNWDADLTVAEWWERLGTSGWAAPTLPADHLMVVNLSGRGDKDVAQAAEKLL